MNVKGSSGIDDAMDFNDVYEALLTAARSVGAEVASPWFYLTVHLTLRIERSIACLTGVHTMPSAVNA